MCHYLGPMWSEIKRKLFHMTALIYVVGIIYLPRPLYLVLVGSALVAVLCVEALRLKIPTAALWFQRNFGALFRTHEATRLSGVPWMLAGVGLTAALLGPVRLASAAILYLILGDAAASLIGIRLGGPHWPGSRKRIVGSLACLGVCLVVGASVLRPEYAWSGVLFGALAATTIEWSHLPINDNFTIPVGSAVVFCLVYRVAPFTGLGS